MNKNIFLPVRTFEERNLFNPAFVSALIRLFVSDSGKEYPVGIPMPLVVVALTASLHEKTRRYLPKTTITALYQWTQDNEDLLIGFPQRAKNITPIIREALIFGITQECLALGSGHQIVLGKERISFGKSFLEDATNEVKDIIDKTAFMARWFAKSGSEASILSAWGVMP